MTFLLRIPALALLGPLAFLACLDAAPRSLQREPEMLTGRVARVGDGDTLDLEAPGHPRLRIRLQGIDAPELAQEHGREAKAALESMVMGREVQVRCGRKDAHNRRLGVVLLGGRDVNQALVAAGHAWHNARFASELPSETTLRYARSQAEARAQRRGLWQIPRPEAPWDWRKRNPRR